MLEHVVDTAVSSQWYTNTRRPVVLLHGGAWDIPDAEVSDYIAGMADAIAIGRTLVGSGAPASEVVVSVVAKMEDSGVFDAGRGSVLRTDGTAVLDAGIMSGSDRSFGAVGMVRRIRNPIAFANTLRRDGRGIVRLAAGVDAEELALEMGHDLVDPEYQICEREVRRFNELRSISAYHTSVNFMADRDPRGTVGCVVLDSHGQLASGTSTGGTPLSPPGRIGDTPLPGCGFYCSANAGASATGWGEAIATVNLCARIVDDADDDRKEAHTILADRLTRMRSDVLNPNGSGATGGAIVVLANGSFGWAYTTPRMARAFWSPDTDQSILL